MPTIEEIYRKHAADLLRFAWWLCGDRAEAEDIASETFLRVWAGSGDLRVETLRAYLFAVARNLFLQRQRRSRRQTGIDPEMPDLAPGPDRGAEERSELEAAMAALRELPEGDRAALLMRVEAELPYEEIARALGISVAAAKVRVHRARRRLTAWRLSKGEP